MNSNIAAPARPQALSALILCAIAATWLIWGSTYLVIRFALVGFAPFFLMATRFICAGALLLGGGMGCVAYAEQTIASALIVGFIALMPLLLVAINLVFRIYATRSEGLAVIAGLGVTPMNRSALPEEIVGTIVYLLSDDSRFVTGSQFTVDGGYSA
jgi:NAD(P)-dependent dehydrogenase (short-subunit alcohol dehydrogenase family)